MFMMTMKRGPSSKNQSMTKQVFGGNLLLSNVFHKNFGGGQSLIC
jgi:hypothetical protein